MNLWQTLLQPDREELENTDKAEMVSAANLLQVGEFQILQLAYFDWHQKDLPEALVSRLFNAYMLGGEVPHWARHYARRILTMAEQGTLNDSHPLYHRYDNDYRAVVPQGTVRFVGAALACGLFVFGGVVLAEWAVDKPASMFPPYFDQSELPKPSDK